LRFLGYCSGTCLWLFWMLIERAWEVWGDRDMPSVCHLPPFSLSFFFFF
jgi:hypothetical protein